MRTVDLVVLICVVLGVALAGLSHHLTIKQCLASVKPKTDSTGHRFVSPFTGKYKRLNGILLCYDSNDTQHAYREAPNES